MPYVADWKPGRILHYHLTGSTHYGKILALGLRPDHHSVAVLILDNPFGDAWRVKVGQAFSWYIEDSISTAYYHFAEECAFFKRDLT